MNEEQKDCIREIVYRELGGDLNVLSITAERDVHINTCSGMTYSEITWFSLSNNDLAKLHRGIEAAMKQRGVSISDYATGYNEGRKYGYDIGYAEGQKGAFRQVTDAMAKAGL